jgi:imidazolonepropionase-like amidohydrolase
MGYLLGLVGHMGGEDDLRQVLDTLIAHPARILGRTDHGLGIGCRADLVVWNADRFEEVVTALSHCWLVAKAGRVTVEHTRSVVEPWRRTT